MPENLFGQRQIGRHQECRPIDRVKTDNILADDMHIRGPVAAEIACFVGIANAGHIGGERIDPNIHDMAGGSRNRHAPIKAGARHAEILQPAFHKTKNLISAAFRANKVGMIAIKLKQWLLIFGQAEEPGFLRCPLNGCPLRRKALVPFPIDQLAFVIKGFIANRIPTFITIKIKIIVRGHCFPKRGAGLFMVALGGPAKTII